MADVLFSKYGVAVNNVKNPAFGAVGDGIVDDTSAIQAAINDSFGTTGSPHGTTATSNKPLYFPHGQYRITSVLTFPKVKGGLIFGDGIFSTQIHQGTANIAALVTNGFEDCRMERLAITTTAGSGMALDLDWDGVGSVGLQRNSFAFVQFSGGSTGYGVRIANSGNQGKSNVFDGCFFQAGTGLATMTASAVGNAVIAGNVQSGVTAGIRVVNGSVSLVDGVGFQNASTCYDIMVDTMSENMACNACRSESAKTLKLRGSGIFKFNGFTQVGVNSSDIFLDIGTSKVILDACVSQFGIITGSSGSLYIRGGGFPSGYLSTFSGTQVQVI